jgi:hypothetical protein
MPNAVHAFLDIPDIIFPIYEKAEDAFHLSGSAVLATVKQQELPQNSVHEGCECNCGANDEVAASKGDVDFDLGFGTTLILAALIMGGIWLFMRWKNKR